MTCWFGPLILRLKRTSHGASRPDCGNAQTIAASLKQYVHGVARSFLGTMLAVTAPRFPRTLARSTLEPSLGRRAKSIQWLVPYCDLGLLVIIAMRPFVVERFYSATAPLPVQARGDLANYERSTIAIFDRASPSVVQVAGTADGGDPSLSGGGEAAVQSGTGFVWDAAGHVVTNNHVVQGTKTLVVRVASGDVGNATIVGVAPNYDIAVIHIDGGGSLPPPISVGSSGDLKVGQAA